MAKKNKDDKEKKQIRNPLVCPRCNSSLSFVDSIRRLEGGRLREFRVCYHCQRKFSLVRGLEPDVITEPLPAAEPEEITEILETDAETPKHKLF